MRGSCHYKATGQCGLWAAGLMPESSSSLQMTVFPPQSRKNRGGRLWSSGGSGIMTGCILPTSTTATTSDILLRQAGKEPQDKHPTPTSAHSQPWETHLSLPRCLKWPKFLLLLL